MTDHAEEKREKDKYDAEVSATNMSDCPIQIIHECHPNLTPDLIIPMIGKVKVEYIRKDVHHMLVREARAKELEDMAKEATEHTLEADSLSYRASQIREGKG